jgi:hypothetical protein
VANVFVFLVNDHWAQIGNKSHISMRRVLTLNLDPKPGLADWDRRPVAKAMIPVVYYGSNLITLHSLYTTRLLKSRGEFTIRP